MIENVVEFAATSLFWWRCYRLWTSEDRKTPYGFRMEDSDVLDDIKFKAKKFAEYVKRFVK